MKPFKPPAAHATRALIVLTVAVQVAATLAGPRFAAELAFAAGLIPLKLAGGVDGGVPGPLTLVTSLFLHSGWVHLVLNLVFLAWVGKYVEWVLGPARFVALYLLGGVAGGLLQVATDPQSIAIVVGASGAIAAVFGCYAVLFARSRMAGRRILGVEVSAEVLTALWFAAVWIALQLLTGLAFGSVGMGVAIWAHVGGFVTGLIFAQPFVKAPQP